MEILCHGTATIRIQYAVEGHLRSVAHENVALMFALDTPRPLRFGLHIQDIRPPDNTLIVSTDPDIALVRYADPKVRHFQPLRGREQASRVIDRALGAVHEPPEPLDPTSLAGRLLGRAAAPAVPVPVQELQGLAFTLWSIAAARGSIGGSGSASSSCGSATLRGKISR